jgi:hypothetical protein
MRKEHWMSAWGRQQISVLRERFYNASHFDQLCLIIAPLFMLSLPIGLFAPPSLMGKIWAGIFFGTWIVDHMWHNRYPALKRWITEREYRRQVVGRTNVFATRHVLTRFIQWA